MKILSCFPTLCVLSISLTMPCQALILVDDTWADGTRSDQNLPLESAWFASTTASLVAETGGMIGQNLAGTRQWITHFTDGTPTPLSVGETLRATLVFYASNVVTAPVTARGLRLGLFNFAGGKRVAADSFSTAGGNGAGVTGYMLNLNFAQAFTINNPLEIRERSNLASTNLMGTSSDFFVLNSGGGLLGSAGFSNGIQYTLEFSVTRSATDQVVITNRFFGDNLNVSCVATDFVGVTFSFDTFAIRENDSSSAELFKFVEFKVQAPLLPIDDPSMIVEPADAFGTPGSNAKFSAFVSGTSSLSYQWYFNTNTLLQNATNSWFAITNLSNVNTGCYSVIITNDYGSVTSRYALLTLDPVITPGVLVNDTWADTNRLNGTFGISNSIWYNCGASAIAALTNLEPGSMTGYVQTNSRTWLTYFTSNRGDVVHLESGQTLKVTLDFSASGILNNTNADLRFGLFNYSALNAVRLGADFASAQAQAENVRGYLLGVNFSSTFHTNASMVPLLVPPLEFRVRTNLASPDLMGNADDHYIKFAEGGASEGAPGFVSGNNYTLEFRATRRDPATVALAARFTGPGLNVSLAAADTTVMNNMDFDTFAIRPNHTNTSGNVFTFTRFKAELLSAPPPFRIIAIEQLTPNLVKLTWESIPSGVYQVQRRDSINSGNWLSIATVTATTGTTSLTNAGNASVALRLYRVVQIE